jgi:omega-6 fatty acid desaturase (delta-12 desaturase)
LQPLTQSHIHGIGTVPSAAGAVPAQASTSKPLWYGDLAKYAHSSFSKSLWQIFNTFVPYCILWALMLASITRGYPYWITLILAVVAGGIVVRIFILFHDCCHGSFFASRRANTILGYVSGILTFTPFEAWRYTHNLHHATAGNLDRRGVGAIWTMTKEEFLAAPIQTRVAYRIYRNPVVLLGLGAALLFLLFQRFTIAGGGKKERFSVVFTNVAILALVLVASLTIGFQTYLLIQLPVIVIGGALGLWLFYVQHQFENVYWARDGVCAPLRVALEGSSYLKLPKVLRWFTGNIGLHHIHHVRPNIPNYNLQQCYNEIPELQAVKTIAIGTSFRSLRLGLYDEEQQKLISFRSLKPRPTRDQRTS